MQSKQLDDTKNGLLGQMKKAIDGTRMEFGENLRQL